MIGSIFNSQFVKNILQEHLVMVKIIEFIFFWRGVII
jgi:hypothetical protein